MRREAGIYCSLKNGKNLEKVKVEACLSHEVAVEKTRNQGAEGYRAASGLLTTQETLHKLNPFFFLFLLFVFSFLQPNRNSQFEDYV